MKAISTLLALTVGAIVLAGCASPQTRIDKNPAVYARFTPEQQQLVKEGKIAIGFDADMVRLALGEPDYVNQLIDQTGTSEIWRYVTYDSYDPGYPYGAAYPYAPYAPYYGRAHYRYGGPYYSFYPGYGVSPFPPQYERTRFRVIFRGGRVVVIENQVR